MIINKEIFPVLKQFNITKDAGLLVLLGIYYNLDIDTVCPESVIKSINLTKIVERDFSGTKLAVKWNMPLFEGQETEWAWVQKYNDMWNINRERKDAWQDVLSRMKEFFTKYPHYRKQDIQRATMSYFATIKDAQYLKSSAKFIFEGKGATKQSHLLGWLQKTGVGEGSINNSRGNIIT